MARSGVERLSKKAILENARRIGFRPGTIIDVGFALGTEGLFEVFEDVKHVLLDPIQEAAPAMERFCQEHAGSIYFLAAASDAEGVLKMVARKGVTGSSFHTKFKREDAQLRDVPTVTLDSIVIENELPKPYLLKLDVEGHELHVLRGAEASCLQDTEMVIMEIGTWAEDHPRGRPSMMDLFRYMEDHGFVFYEFAEPGYRPIDGALYMFDAVFVKTDSVLRQERSHKTPEQAAIARKAKEDNVQAVLKSG